MTRTQAARPNYAFQFVMLSWIVLGFYLALSF
jgi:hypothetical protein